MVAGLREMQENQWVSEIRIDTGEFDEYKKWMSSLYTPLSWNYKDDWYIWQYLNRGELEGYTGGEKYIDLNVINKEKELEDLIITMTNQHE